MAALAIMEIDNAIVEVDGPELPAGDGSAALFVEFLQKAGFQFQNKPASFISISEPIFVRDKDSMHIALPYDGLRFSYTLSFSHSNISDQYIDSIFIQDYFINQIAPARTFAFAEEIEELHKSGMALGGTPDNAVLISKDGVMSKLRFKDELVRHKLLDMFGDLYLNGRLKGHFIGIKSGHMLNVQLSRLISGQSELEKE
jgi:UDP-3-O-[3-hydroxymyristoyl] N-acetylglucosamine deacetylase